MKLAASSAALVRAEAEYFPPWCASKRDFKPRGDKPRSDFRDGNRDNAKGSWSKPKGDFKKDGFKKDGKKFGDGGFSKKRRGE